jgi:cytochrome oxidase Cu insertion factor (SCO1/SenC/PrrC family)
VPGMHSGLNDSNPVLVAAFRSALMHQGLIALLVLTSLAVAWASLREWRPALSRSAYRHGDSAGTPEHVARRVLRIGFGVLWVFDGLLQAQPAMAAGLPSKVIAPAAATSPRWVQDVVNWSGSAWSYHPIQASAAAVWIQVGIGVWMLAAPRGWWSRLAGLASVGWGLAVWAFGEAFGGIFAPGLTVLFGAPGAVLLYCVAGWLIALPERSWQAPALGRRLLAGTGIFFIAMAVVQAWPGRGFWQGTSHGGPGTLTAMVGQMSATPQPAVLGHLVGDFGSFTASHGFAVNAFAVATLLALGLGLVTRRRELLRPVVIAAAVFCLADWVLIEDLGFLGGLGTDPNSMIPLLLLVVPGYLAVTRTAPAVASEPDQEAAAAAGPSWRERLRPGRLAGGFASISAAGVLAIWAAGVVLLGAAPMAMAQANPNADPIIARALDGSTALINEPASSFHLTDQAGQPVSLASLHGKVILMTFLDPVCTTDCPLIAQELRATDQLLGSRASQVEIVAVAANPLYYSRPYLQAFDRQEGMNGLPNWLYLTGPLDQLRRVWNDYGVSVDVLPSGQMIAHNDLVFVISGGRIRNEINADPGAGTASSKSSFTVVFAKAAEQALGHDGSPS